MTCFMCKGSMQESTTTYMTEYHKCYIIIKNVPCSKCAQCGEEYLNGATLAKNQFQTMFTDISLPKYIKSEKRALTQTEKDAIPKADFSLMEKSYVYLI